jgi:hypothetical protein
MPGGETQGLVADWTIGDQDRGICAIGAAAREQFRAILVEGGTLTTVGRRTVEASSRNNSPSCVKGLAGAV